MRNYLIAAGLFGLALLFHGYTYIDQSVRAPVTYTVDFSSGVTVDEDRISVIAEEIADFLEKNPERVIVITGHSGTVGDIDANKDLSAKRADRIAALLEDEVEAPIRKVAAGASRPLERLEDETDQAYQRRLSRADISVELIQ